MFSVSYYRFCLPDCYALGGFQIECAALDVVGIVPRIEVTHHAIGTLTTLRVYIIVISHCCLRKVVAGTPCDSPSLEVALGELLDFLRLGIGVLAQQQVEPQTTAAYAPSVFFPLLYSVLLAHGIISNAE